MIDVFGITKMLILSSLGFVLAMLWTPLLTHVLYKYKMGKSIRSAVAAPMFSKLHQKKAGVPTMGGVLVWGTVLLIAILLAVAGSIFPQTPWVQLSFLSRSETWLPLAALGLAGILGLIDDILNVWKIGPYGGGIHSGQRLVIYTVVGLVGAWWFYSKLGWDMLHVPFIGDVFMGWWYVPFFVLVMIATSFSVNQTDGLDGLAGGTLASAFGAYAIIALMQGKEDLATLCATIVGALIAFLWFNIYPARFIMGDTGAMSLGVTLAVVAMLTNAGLLMPIIGVVFLVETITTIMQVLSKKIRGKKIFLIAPIHHHFEAKGWPEPKVVMRFWVISWIGAALGLAIALLESSMT